MFRRFFKDTMKETSLCVSIVLTAEMLKTQATKFEKAMETITKSNQNFFKDGRCSPGPKNGRLSPGPSNGRCSPGPSV
jgi:hypothetical protein